jgi:hypothetical protein
MSTPDREGCTETLDKSKLDDHSIDNIPLSEIIAKKLQEVGLNSN